MTINSPSDVNGGNCKKTFFCFFSASAVASATDVVVALECHSHNDSGSNINLSTKKGTINNTCPKIQTMHDRKKSIS